MSCRRSRATEALFDIVESVDSTGRVMRLKYEGRAQAGGEEPAEAGILDLGKMVNPARARLATPRILAAHARGAAKAWGCATSRGLQNA